MQDETIENKIIEASALAKLRRVLFWIMIVMIGIAGSLAAYLFLF